MRLLMLLLVAALAAPAQVLKYAELNSLQIQKLDRAHTVVVLTNGILEEHGPYLPSYIDGYWQEALAQSLVKSLAARPGWTVVTLPVIPIGTAPANVIAKRYSFPGSVTVRASTMRDLFMDLADALGNQGFQHVFVVDAHGGPPNSVMLDQAGAYFHDTYGGEMVHLYGLMPVVDCCRTMEAFLTKKQIAENGLSVHADTMEVSEALYVVPSLVNPAYKVARINGGADFATLMQTAAAPDWPGYFGAPSYASAAMGKRYFDEMTAVANGLANGILDGKVDSAAMPHYGTIFVDLTPEIERALLQNEARQAAQHQAWLEAHPTKFEKMLTSSSAAGHPAVTP